MKILVFGGTGTIGRYLVNILSERFSVVVTSRKAHYSNNPNIVFIKGNAHDNQFLQEILEKDRYDVIVDFMIYAPDEFSQRINFILLHTGQYVFLSSSRVYAYSRDPITEQSDRLLDTVNDPDFLSSQKYAIAKAIEENMLYESNCSNYTIIRPYITYGISRFQLGVYEKEDWLYRVLNGRSVVFSRDIADKLTTMTFANDVAAGIAAVVGNETTFGETFNITCNYSLKWNDVLKIYKEVLETRGYSFNVIYADYASEVINREEQVKYDRAYDRSFNNYKIGQYINVNHFKSQKDGIRLCLNQFMDHPDFKEINWVSQARMDKYAKEYSPMLEIRGFKNKIKYILFRYIVDYNTAKKIANLFTLKF